MNSINFKNTKFWNQIESETKISKFCNSSDSNDDWKKISNNNTSKRLDNIKK